MDFKLQPAWVLHARAYRESSLLVEAHIRDHGRIGLVARGARGSRSRWKGLLQPFRPLLLSWRQRGELGTLTDAEQIAPLPPLEGERCSAMTHTRICSTFTAKCWRSCAAGLGRSGLCAGSKSACSKRSAWRCNSTTNTAAGA